MTTSNRRDYGASLINTGEYASDLRNPLLPTTNKGVRRGSSNPSIYRWAEKDTDPALIPQLTYAEDHPGSAMPAIRFSFEITP